MTVVQAPSLGAPVASVRLAGSWSEVKFMRHPDVPLPSRCVYALRVTAHLARSPIVSQSFFVMQSRGVSPDPSLRGDIRARTGSDAATSGILRSIERFGSDPSIIRFEVSPKESMRFGGPARAVAWTVRAVRS